MRTMVMTALVALTLVPAAAQTPGQAPGQAPAPTLASYSPTAQAERLGATEVTARPIKGGVVLGGKLAGRQFAVAIPDGWAGDALVYAHGYTTPGTPVAVAADPTAADAPQALQVAFEQGLAAGHIAYDKAGMGVKTGATNTLALRDFLVRLGAKRVYLAGSSMGGNIVMALVERHPRAFAGALAQCGVTNGWESQFGQLFDMRLAYDHFTRGTPYALPGERDVTRSALPVLAPPGQEARQAQFGMAQIGRVALPIFALFRAAAADPKGREAAMIRKIAALSGFEPEVASFAYPLVVISLGADDLRATLGGQVYGNIGKVYASAELTAAEAAALNRDVQRFAADPKAVAEARRWHQVTGRIRIPLVTMHNVVDSLVPYSQAEALTRIVRRAGSGKWVMQYGVPATREPLPVGGVEGYTHCGFSREQVGTALSRLTHWVRTGQRPPADPL